MKMIYTFRKKFLNIYTSYIQKSLYTFMKVFLNSKIKLLIQEDIKLVHESFPKITIKKISYIFRKGFLNFFNKFFFLEN